MWMHHQPKALEPRVLPELDRNNHRRNPVGLELRRQALGEVAEILAGEAPIHSGLQHPSMPRRVWQVPEFVLDYVEPMVQFHRCMHERNPCRHSTSHLAFVRVSYKFQ
jgi:hypothetical protein